MIKIFRNNFDITNIINIINIKYKNEPKIIISDYNFFFDSKNIIRSEDINIIDKLKNFLNDKFLIDFIILDNKIDLISMQDNFSINGLLEILYRKDLFSDFFFKKYNQKINQINNLIYFDGSLEEKTYYIVQFLKNNIFKKIFNKKIKIFLFLSSINDITDLFFKYYLSSNNFIFFYPLVSYEDFILLEYENLINKIIEKKKNIIN